MSASAPPTPGTAAPRQALLERVQNFWQRVSEGRALDDLWNQFAADARSGYGFYGKDVDWEEIQKLPRWKRAFPVVRQFFWALMNKLSPARRVLLLVALVMLLFSDVKLALATKAMSTSISSSSLRSLFLFLLSLELADKVIMKRDLEIAREIQTWLVPSQPPVIRQCRSRLLDPTAKFRRRRLL